MWLAFGIPQQTRRAHVNVLLITDAFITASVCLVTTETVVVILLVPPIITTTVDATMLEVVFTPSTTCPRPLKQCRRTKIRVSIARTIFAVEINNVPSCFPNFSFGCCTSIRMGDTNMKFQFHLTSECSSHSLQQQYSV
jgi:hypothetical protein